MKKNVIKIILDVILAAVLILMYNANVLTLEFHEIGGLILIGAFFIHIALSPKWIASVTKKLFSKSLSAKLRLNYILDFLLLVCIVVILISGIIISKVVFAGTNDQVWKAWHYFASAMALALGGVHIGLHWAFIKCMFCKIIKLPKILGRALGIILIAAVLIYGGYSIASSGFARWISAPFTASSPGGVQIIDKGQLQNGTGGKFEQFSVDGQLPGDKPGNGTQFQGGKGGNEEDGKGQFVLGGGSGKGSAGVGKHFGKVSESVIEVIASYSSIAGLFAIVTAFTAKLLKKNKKPTESLPQANAAEQSDKQEG